MDQQESLMNAAANVLAHRQRGNIRFTRGLLRVTGIWVKDFPGNTSRADFLAMFCQMEKREDLVRKIVSGYYTVTTSSSGEGYDVKFK